MTPLESYEKKMRMMELIIHGVVAGTRTHGAIFSGSQGIGKSFTIEKALSNYGDKINITTIRGKITPMSTFLVLLENCEPNNIIWFDDADSVIANEDSLNIIKAAVDTKVVREVSWISTANMSEQSFFFKGKILVSTNISLRKSPHFAAIQDRMNCYDLNITSEEKLHKIKDLAKSHEDIPEEVGNKVIDFMFKHKEILDDVSLRTFIKTAALVMDMPDDDWESIAEVLILR